MLYLLFKNSLGEIKFSGSGNESFSLTHISGLGLPDKIYQTQEYVDFDGQQTVSSRFAKRTITISFDLKGENVSPLTAKLYRVLSQEGTLYVVSQSYNRRTKVSQISVDSFGGNKNCRSFTAQFVCDNPYFWDNETVSLPCCQINGNIRFDTSLSSWNLNAPVIWGESINDTIITNCGDARAYPVITLRSAGNAEDNNGFEILRVNPDNADEVLQRFALQYLLSDGENITLCFNPYSDKNRRYIKSSSGLNLLNFRSEDSSLWDFYLDCGKNRIIVNNLSRGNVLSAHLSFENQYVEGVF